MRVQCEYCNILNPEGSKECIACGAPLPSQETIPVKVAVPLVEVTQPVPVPSVDTQAVAQQLKEGAAIVGTSLGALGIGSFILRTAAEATAIAVSAFITGINAGNSGAGLNNHTLFLVLAAVGGALIGLAVGSARKRVLFALLSAPVGAILGSVLAVVLKLNISGSPWVALLSAAGASLLALFGGRRKHEGRISWFQRVRPVLGLIGGLLFGLLGYAAGFKIY